MKFPIQNVFSVVLRCLCVSGTACGMKLNSRLDPKAAADPQNAFAAAPLETQEKRPSTALLVLGQCVDPLAHGLDQRNDERIPHGEIAQSFRYPGCPIIREAVEPFAFDGR